MALERPRGLRAASTVALAGLTLAGACSAPMNVRPMNFVPTSIIQGTPDPWKLESSREERAHARPLWEAGLTGTGELVGVGDTGLDVWSCYFFGETAMRPGLLFVSSCFARPGTPSSSSPDPNATDPGPQHRKVLARRFLGSKVDGPLDRQHGTHTCGSVLGQALGGGAPAMYDGMAKDAKARAIILTGAGVCLYICG